MKDSNENSEAKSEEGKIKKNIAKFLKDIAKFLKEVLIFVIVNGPSILLGLISVGLGIMGYFQYDIQNDMDVLIGKHEEHAEKHEKQEYFYKELKKTLTDFKDEHLAYHKTQSDRNERHHSQMEEAHKKEAASLGKYLNCRIQNHNKVSHENWVRFFHMLSKAAGNHHGDSEQVLAFAKECAEKIEK